MGLNPTILRQTQAFASAQPFDFSRYSPPPLPRERFSRVPGMFGSLEVKDPMGVWIATGALGRVRLLNHPLWRRPCKLQLTEPMRRPLSKQTFPQFLCLWNSADLPG